MRIRPLAFFFLAMTFIVIGLLYQLRDLYTGFRSASDFKTNGHKYVAIVDYLSRVSIPPSDTVYFYCDSDWDVRKIKSIPFVHPFAGTMGHFNIEAKRLADGSLLVTLVTKNLGHSGVYAYIYCSGDLKSPKHIEGNWTVDESLQGHWWVVSNRLG